MKKVFRAAKQLMNKFSDYFFIIISQATQS